MKNKEPEKKNKDQEDKIELANELIPPTINNNLGNSQKTGNKDNKAIKDIIIKPKDSSKDSSKNSFKDTINGFFNSLLLGIKNNKRILCLILGIIVVLGIINNKGADILILISEKVETKLIDYLSDFSSNSQKTDKKDTNAIV